MSRAHSYFPSQAATALLAASLLFAAGCSRSDSVSAKSNGPAVEKPIKVSSAPVVTRQVPVFIQASGSFAADESTDLAPLVAGRIATTPVDIGAFVKQGDVVVTLDDSDAKLRLEQAQAALAQSEASLRQSQSRIGLAQSTQFDVNNVPEVQAALAAANSAAAQAKLAEADARRYANLVATGDVSQSNYDKQRTAAETAVAQAESARKQYEAALNAARQNYQGVGGAEASLTGARAQVAIARKAIADAIIRAPMAGYVSDRPAAVGEYVATSTKIATILRANPIKLNLQLSEAEAGRVHPGMPVAARVAAYGERDFTGRVRIIGPAIDPGSRSMLVEAEFANADLILRPGMFATARLLLPEGEQGVFVPASSVLTDVTTSASQIFVLENGRARSYVVRLGDTVDGNIRVLSGLPATGVVATSNLKDLFDGAAVQK